jgi:hypothetical protein
VENFYRLLSKEKDFLVELGFKGQCHGTEKQEFFYIHGFLRSCLVAEFCLKGQCHEEEGKEL